MEKLQKKLKKQGGFTLVEMLIVVAIIAILIAVSIPMVSGALDRAREATDAANVRAAKAQASITKLDPKYEVNGAKIGWGDDTDPTVNIYDADKGIIVPTNATDKPTAYGKSSDNEKKVVFLAIYKDVVYYQWAEPSSSDSIDFDVDSHADWHTDPAHDAKTLK